MNARVQARSDTWLKARGWVVGLTGFLVVIPSLINAGVDIYKSVLSIPRTEAEKINAELFKKHFNKTALVTVPVPIKTASGSLAMELSVYDGGDVFVQYGDHTRWFPFSVKKITSVSILSPAYADPTTPLAGTGKYSQTDKAENKTIIRERYYSNGVKESYVIDTRTGNIKDKTVTQHARPTTNTSRPPTVKVRSLPVIDLNSFKPQPQTPAPVAALRPRLKAAQPRAPAR